ncbi:MAG: hypothetical protein M5R36_13175 [Deltaproteobacteria bacterium]|nr:hypothetical protein [Deltaproteobacteria bacterium]
MLIAAAPTISCDIPEFDPPNIIKTQRILAIRTEPREAAPGDTVTVTGLAVNDDGTEYVGPIAWIVTGTVQLTYGEETEPGEVPQGETYLQIPGGPPFTFTIPEGAAFEEQYGDYYADGTVLTVAMAIGDQNDPTIGVKSMIVMDEPVKENPVFKKLHVIVEGEETEADEGGLYPIGEGGQIKLVADADFPTGDDDTYHWFTATEGSSSTWSGTPRGTCRKKSDVYDLYCVVRENSRTTIRDGQYRIQSSGLDWKHIRVEVASGEDR